MWKVLFEDEECYEADETLKLVVVRSMQDERIVGLKIYDEVLSPPKKEAVA